MKPEQFDAVRDTLDRTELGVNVKRLVPIICETSMFRAMMLVMLSDPIEGFAVSLALMYYVSKALVEQEMLEKIVEK